MSKSRLSKFITFVEDFLDAPPAALRFTPSFLGKWKLLRRNIYHVLLIYIWLVILEFLNFECFRTSRNYHFRLLLCGVLAIIPPDVVKIWNINQWCNVLYGIRYATILIVILQKWLKMGSKALFLAHFDRFVVYVLLCPIIYALRVWKMKNLIEIHICGKFHQYSIRGCQVFRTDSASMKWTFLRVFWVLTSPNKVRLCWNFHHRYSVIIQKHCFKNSLGFFNFFSGSNGT